MSQQIQRIEEKRKEKKFTTKKKGENSYVWESQ